MKLKVTHTLHRITGLKRASKKNRRKLKNEKWLAILDCTKRMKVSKIATNKTQNPFIGGGETENGASKQTWEKKRERERARERAKTATFSDNRMEARIFRFNWFSSWFFSFCSKHASQWWVCLCAVYEFAYCTHNLLSYMRWQLCVRHQNVSTCSMRCGHNLFHSYPMHIVYTQRAKETHTKYVLLYCL